MPYSSSNIAEQTKYFMSKISSYGICIGKLSGDFKSTEFEISVRFHPKIA